MEKLVVLVVDDEDGIRSGVKRILGRFNVDYPFMDDQIGFDVDEASTGEEAIEYINNRIPDIVLLDNKLPGIQGTDVLEYIRKEQLDITVMMITSHASLDVAIKATSIGAYDFVPKPFTPQELKSSIENITKHIFLRRVTKKLNKDGKQIRFQFLKMLSHELKAPINAIEGYLLMMEEKTMGEKIEDYSQIIGRSLDRLKGMRSLIMDLLDLTQIESDNKPDSHKKIGLISVAANAIDTFRPYAIQKDISIELCAPDKLEMNAREEEIEIILNNLISNAVKYNHQGGKVRISLGKLDDKIFIRVEDTGMGIPDADKENIFKEFYRVKNTGTKKISGSGLGLSIVQKLVEMQNGSITLESEQGKGSIFTVEFPIIDK